jgi:NAD(P)-dependent dehydrogenase (short-subunit alcohol dehydrogenase family)
MRTLAELLSLEGRTALVTGGAGHIGRVVGETLVELGATVAILDADEAGSRTSVEALSRLRSGAAIAVPCDLLDEGATRASVREAMAKLGGLDVVVHCAAYVGTTSAPGWAVPFDEQTVDAWDRALRVNLTSAFIIVQTARETLAASGRGSAILFGSIYGMVGPDFRLYEDTTLANPAGYAASKGALLQLTRYLATLLAPRIRVNAISPGGIWRNQPDAFHQRYVGQTPLRRMGTEEDIKGAVAYLSSDLSAYVTGHNLVVDGGWTA